MIKIILSGCNGRMGQVITRLCAEREDTEIVAGFDLNPVQLSTFPVYSNPKDFTGEADVLIDFSNPKSLNSLLSFCTSAKIACVLCTTGYNSDELVQILNASKDIPIFKSGNMSLGINLICGLLKKAAKVLGASYDVEIIEKHHKMKLDSPSGTALMLADAVASSLPYEANYVYDRSDRRELRPKNEIGISAIRGGTIVGEHEVIFAGEDEVIEFTHIAHSRNVFANGAISAAIYLSGVKENGMFDMNNLLEEIMS